MQKVFLLYFILCIFSYSYPYNYTVKKNDSLWIIAKNNNISLSDIKRINDLYNDSISEGQKLFIPNSITNYIVKSGESFQNIADKFDTKLKYIITLNNISENYTIEGQRLSIPLVDTHKSELVSQNQNISTAKITPITYKVQRGDTLSDIAIKYKTTVPKLKQLNNKNNNAIYVGQKLIIGSKKETSNQLANTNQNVKKITYVVKHGDTLGQIAINHKVSSKDILNWNKKNNATIYNKEKLVIYINDSNVNPSKSDNYKHIKYVVKRGDNLSYIAAKFQTSPATIKKINRKNNNNVYIGETLNIPVKITKELEHSTASRISETSLIRYKVKRGDTLDEIAIRYKVKRSDLLSWNNKRSTRIFIGENIKIYVPKKSSTLTSKVNKKAVYTGRNNINGVRSNKFNDIPLPFKASQILSTKVSGRGVDVILKDKLNIQSPASAKIQYAGYINALQNVVILQLSNNRTIVYAGMEKLNVQTGQDVSKGYLLGAAGLNQIEKTPKIYMEMRDQDKIVNVLHSYKELAYKNK